MDSKDKERSEWKGLIKSFSFAIHGFIYVAKTERNMKIHLCISAFVLLLSFLFTISAMQFCIILLLIGSVISLELMNSAIERTVDMVTKEYNILAKYAKDAAAAAVLILSIISVIIGCIIFYPPFIQFITKILV